MTTKIIRPSGAGAYATLSGTGGAHWNLVNDVSPDNNTTYVYIYGYGTDSYTISTASLPGRALIQSVKLTTVTEGISWATVIHNLYKPSTAGLDAGYSIRCDDGDGVWSVYGTVWSGNPFTSAAWERADLDDLQIGLTLYAAYGTTKCTQLYMTVTYTLLPSCGQVRIIGMMM